MDLWSLTDLCTPWCILVAATLKVADHIDAGHTEIAALAAACRADRDSLHRLLRYLVSKGIFQEPAPGRFALNECSTQFLNPGARLALDLDGIGGRMAYAWGTLLSAVRTGKPAYHEVFGRPFWDDLDAHPQVAATFDALMGPEGHGKPDPNILGDPAGWNSVHTVVDVGGGAGWLLAEILRAHPSIRGTLVELPRTAARAKEVFEAAGVSDRAAIAAQSFFDPLPAGAGLYLVKNVLNDWPDPEAIALLRRCAEAARPSGRVLVFTGAGPGDEASPELLMLVLVGGRARTFDEFGQMARRAGLQVQAWRRLSPGRVLVECVPAHA